MKFQLLGREFEVQGTHSQSGNIDDGVQAGSVNIEEYIIYITEIQPFSTLIHEIIHAYQMLTGQDSIGSVDKLYEYIPEVCSRCLDQLVLENSPKIIEELYMYSTHITKYILDTSKQFKDDKRAKINSNPYVFVKEDA